MFGFSYSSELFVRMSQFISICESQCLVTEGTVGTADDT